MSRRTFSREAGNPLSIFHDKHASTREKSWSMFRIILFGFFLGYLSNWPRELSGPAVALAACIIFGLPVRDLFERAPVTEALDALRAFFDNVMGKAAAAVPKTVPHQWRTGDPNEGII